MSTALHRGAYVASAAGHVFESEGPGSPCVRVCLLQRVLVLVSKGKLSVLTSPNGLGFAAVRDDH